MKLVVVYTTILIVFCNNYGTVNTAAGGGNSQKGTPREFTVLHPPCERLHGNLPAEPRTEGNTGRIIQSAWYFEHIPPPLTIPLPPRACQHGRLQAEPHTETGTVTDFQIALYYQHVPPPFTFRHTNVRHGLEDRPATAELHAAGSHYGGPPLLHYTPGTAGAPDTTHMAPHEWQPAEPAPSETHIDVMPPSTYHRQAVSPTPNPLEQGKSGINVDAPIPAHNNEAAENNIGALAVGTHHGITSTFKAAGELENVAAASSSNSVTHNDQAASEHDIDPNVAHLAAHLDTGAENSAASGSSVIHHDEEPGDSDWAKNVDWYEYGELHPNADTPHVELLTINEYREKMGLTTSANADSGEQERRTVRQRHADEPLRQDAHIQQQVDQHDGQHGNWRVDDANSERRAAQHGRQHDNWRAHNGKTEREQAHPDRHHENPSAHNANTGRELAQAGRHHEDPRAHNANTGRTHPTVYYASAANTGREQAQLGRQHENPSAHDANTGRELAHAGRHHEDPKAHNANTGRTHPTVYYASAANTGREQAQLGRQHDNVRVHHSNTGREQAQLGRQHENPSAHDANIGREQAQLGRQHENPSAHDASTGRELAQPDRQHENPSAHDANTGHELAQPVRQHRHRRVYYASAGARRRAHGINEGAWHKCGRRTR